MKTLRYMSGMSTAAVLAVALTACGGSSTHTASSVTKTTSANTSSAAVPSVTSSAASASTTASTVPQTSSTSASSSSAAATTQIVTKTAAPVQKAASAATHTPAKPTSKEGGYCGSVSGHSGVLDVTASGPVHCGYAMNVAKSVVSGTFTSGSVTAYSPDAGTSFTSTCGGGDGGYMCTPPNGGSISIMIPGFKLP